MNIDKKFLLVCLQLIIVLVMSMIVEGMLTVESRIEASPRHHLNGRLYSSLSSLSSFPGETTTGKPLHQRIMRLHHKNSGKHVVIKENRVTVGNPRDMSGNLVLETTNGEDETLRVQIRGIYSETYVCYNDKGRVIAKPKDKANNGTGCFFKEEQIGGEFRYRSLFNRGWVLGFNRKGKPLRGPAFRQEKFYRFIKLEVNTTHLTENFGIDPYRVDVAKHNNEIGHLPRRDKVNGASFKKRRHRHRHQASSPSVSSPSSYPSFPSLSSIASFPPLSPSGAGATRHRHRHEGHLRKSHRHRHRHVENNPLPHPKLPLSSYPLADR